VRVCETTDSTKDNFDTLQVMSILLLENETVTGNEKYQTGHFKSCESHSKTGLTLFEKVKKKVRFVDQINAEGSKQVLQTGNEYDTGYEPGKSNPNDNSRR